MTKKGESIRHFPAAHPLPDWRNFGVMLRVLLAVNAGAACIALAQAANLAEWLPRFLELAALVEPVLLLALALLALLRNLLWRLPIRLGQGLVLALVLFLTLSLLAYGRLLGLLEPAGLGRTLALAALLTVGLLVYFQSRAEALSPALAEARLAALNARIRPHFLFNSLNAVLSLIRARPQEAEAALEALADLFRAALRDPAARVPLSDEIALARQYLDLEKLRLGERLAVDWQIEAVPEETPIPPLLLQPLLENAIHHGIEPLPGGGVIGITIRRQGPELHLLIVNPAPPGGGQPGGHHMALDNIRERLSLVYDLESRLDCRQAAGRYEVRMVLPCPLPAR